MKTVFQGFFVIIVGVLGTHTASAEVTFQSDLPARVEAAAEEIEGIGQELAVNPEERAYFFSSQWQLKYEAAQALLEEVLSDDSLKGSSAEDIAQQNLGALNLFRSIYPA